MNRWKLWRECSLDEPLGTITKYYKFIDEETKSILNSLMEESSSYYDFVQRLSDMVLENEVPVNLAYLAAVQAWWCRIEETTRRIQEKYRDVPCIRPWAYIHNSVEIHQLQYHDSVVKAIEKAIESSVEDWMEVDLHLLHTFYHWPLGDIPSYFEPLEKAKSLIDANPLLKCFESLVYAFEGIVIVREGAIKDSLAILQRGKELAEEHDDALFMYMNLLQEGNILRTFNVQDALTRFEELYDLAQDLDAPYFIAEVLNDSAVVFEVAGEYDLAISSHQETMKVLDMVDVPDHLPSRVYASLGDGQRSLEAINRYLEYVGPLETPTYYLRKARALALLNRLEEADRYLDTAHSLTIKIGSERHLGTYYDISGLVELKRGDFLAALDLLERAWEISERIPAGVNQNSALLGLAQAEILLTNESSASTKLAAPGKWLSKLEKYAMERELPGIRMQAALLKSEFYQNHGQLKDAHATLVGALNITDSLGVKTLRERISARIKELNRLMVDEELVS